MDFKTLLMLAKDDEAPAINQIINMYKPLLIKYSIVNGTFDEDLYQELQIKLLHCIKNFKI